jgi:hypothetical protein
MRSPVVRTPATSSVLVGAQVTAARFSSRHSCPGLPAPGPGFRLGSRSPVAALRRLTVTVAAANVGVSTLMGEIHAVWPICHLRMLTWAFVFDDGGRNNIFFTRVSSGNAFTARCACCQESVRVNGIETIHCAGDDDQLSEFASEVCRCTCICACKTAKIAWIGAIWQESTAGVAGSLLFGSPRAAPAARACPTGLALPTRPDSSGPTTTFKCPESRRTAPMPWLVGHDETADGGSGLSLSSAAGEGGAA